MNKIKWTTEELAVLERVARDLPVKLQQQGYNALIVEMYDDKYPQRSFRAVSQKVSRNFPEMNDPVDYWSILFVAKNVLGISKNVVYRWVEKKMLVLSKSTNNSFKRGVIKKKILENFILKYPYCIKANAPNYSLMAKYFDEELLDYVRFTDLSKAKPNTIKKAKRKVKLNFPPFNGREFSCLTEAQKVCGLSYCALYCRMKNPKNNTVVEVK